MKWRKKGHIHCIFKQVKRQDFLFEITTLTTLFRKKNFTYRFYLLKELWDIWQITWFPLKIRLFHVMNLALRSPKCDLHNTNVQLCVFVNEHMNNGTDGWLSTKSLTPFPTFNFCPYHSRQWFLNFLKINNPFVWIIKPNPPQFPPQNFCKSLMFTLCTLKWRF